MFYIVQGLAKVWWKNLEWIPNGTVNIFLSLSLIYQYEKPRWMLLTFGTLAKSTLPTLAQRCLLGFSNCKLNSIAQCWRSIFLTQPPFLPISVSLFSLCCMYIYSYIIACLCNWRGGRIQGEEGGTSKMYTLLHLSKLLTLFRHLQRRNELSSPPFQLVPNCPLKQGGALAGYQAGEICWESSRRASWSISLDSTIKKALLLL